MKKRQGKKFLTMILVSALTVGLLSGSYTNVSEAEASVRYATDVDTPSEGCVLVGVKGSYIVDAQGALDRINEIRLEACREGVENPDTGVALTEADYVPIKWSSDLEYIAKIRAAEAGVFLGHDRTNGKSCFSLRSPGGQQSWGEVLAWNWSASMTRGIEQWYGEKEDWVNKTSGKVTGHYTQMIDPTNLYVGMGCFYSGSTKYSNTTSGEFSSGAGASEVATQSEDDCIQTIEVKSDYLSDVSIQGDDTLSVGQNGIVEVQGTVSYTSGVGATTTTVFLEADWESSNPSVVTVDEEGNITGEAVGVFFASTFWTKLQNIFGHYCKSKLDKVAKPRLAAILPAA